ncbi:sensor histidine kinase [Verrucomicrobium spinosum]|uniref:sensor histidine kinase n=1 Tax=Verrucomicrobium spinosum TaxID=2736 RepID=UPI000B122906
MARRVNHDLRSPLGGITTTAELIKELLGESNAELAALTDPLFDSAQSMIRLMDRISFMARAVADPPSGALVAMTEVVWAAEQRLQRQLMRKKITIRRPASWPEVSGVAAWLEVVWLNLMSNAIEHSVAETEVQLFWELAGTRAVRFGVRDTGKGVPPAKRSQLFYPFHLLQQPNSLMAWACRLCNGWWRCRAERWRATFLKPEEVFFPLLSRSEIQKLRRRGCGGCARHLPRGV